MRCRVLLKYKINLSLVIRWNIKSKKVLNHWEVPYNLERKLFYSKSKNLIFTINLLSNIIFFDYTNGCNIFTIAMFQNIKYPSLHPLRYNTYAYTTEEHHLQYFLYKIFQLKLIH